MMTAGGIEIGPRIRFANTFSSSKASDRLAGGGEVIPVQSNALRPPGRGAGAARLALGLGIVTFVLPLLNLAWVLQASWWEETHPSQGLESLVPWVFIPVVSVLCFVTGASGVVLSLIARSAGVARNRSWVTALLLSVIGALILPVVAALYSGDPWVFLQFFPFVVGAAGA